MSSQPFPAKRGGKHEASSALNNQSLCNFSSLGAIDKGTRKRDKTRWQTQKGAFY